jgi:hypothetical protein
VKAWDHAVVAALALLTSWWPVQTAIASTGRGASLPRILELSTYAFAGTVDSMVVMFTPGRMATNVHFSRLNWAKGTWESDTLTLRMPGSAQKGHLPGVVGMPQFETGHRYVILSPKNLSEEVPILGMTQGFYPIEFDSSAGEFCVHDSRGRPLLSFKDGNVVVYGHRTLPGSLPPPPANDSLPKPPYDIKFGKDPGTRVSEAQFLGELRRLAKVGR